MLYCKGYFTESSLDITMTLATTTTTTDRRFTPRQYRLGMWTCLVGGGVGYLAGLRFEYPLVTLGIYWAGFLAFLTVWKGSPVTLYDERDEALEARAWSVTGTVLGAVLILVGPSLPAIMDAGYEVSDLALGAIFGYAALFGVWGVAYAAIRYGPTLR